MVLVSPSILVPAFVSSHLYPRRWLTVLLIALQSLHDGLRQYADEAAEEVIVVRRSSCSIPRSSCHGAPIYSCMWMKKGPGSNGAEAWTINTPLLQTSPAPGRGSKR
jgi:hypothetical protein